MQTNRKNTVELLCCCTFDSRAFCFMAGRICMSDSVSRAVG